MATITDVMVKYNIEPKRQAFDGEGSAYYICPFCNDSKGKLNVRPHENIWRCAKCGEGGGVIDFIQKIEDISRKEASYKAFHLELASQDVEKARKMRERAEASKVVTSHILKPDELDKVYRAMLAGLSLSRRHIEDLKRRGLDDDDIFSSNYRSIPADDSRLPAKLIKEGYRLKGVPGFYKENGVWKMVIRNKGYLIPFINAKGQITSLQIRCDKVKNGQKYIAFSSNGYPEGTKVKSQAHYNGSLKKMPNTLYITEGALKADIASKLCGKIYGKETPFLAIAGVNNLKSLTPTLEYFKKKGVKRIVDCFDMDKAGNNEGVELNPQVRKGVNKIIKTCEELGFDVSSMHWATGKGIDDYLLYKKSLKK